jgi:protein O-GlcNAc transferase
MNEDTADIDSIVAGARDHHRAGRLDAAADGYDAVLARDPDNADALHLKGVLLAQRGAASEGLSLLERAVRIAPGDGRAWANLAKLRLDMGDVEGAVADYGRATTVDPDHADLRFNAAGALAQAGRRDEAIAELERACALDETHVQSLANLGNLYRQAGRLTESREALERAAEVSPGNPQVLHSLGVTLAGGRDYARAAARFRRALELDRGFVRAAAQLFYTTLFAGDWSDRERLVTNFERLIARGGDQVAELSPLIALFLPVGQAAQNAVARARACAVRARVMPPSPPAGPVREAGRPLRVGYLSADFGRHPVGHLAAGLLGHHDRSRVSVSLFALAPPDGSDVQQVLFGAGDSVHELARMSAAAAASEIAAAETDILVDLGGFTQGAHPEILAMHPAPLQVGWLGYCGSTGGLNDAIIADEVLLPEAAASDFDEAVAYVPGSFMPLNNFDPSSADPGSRGALGLPEHGVVFCAFNTPTKIDPRSFAAWMRILSRVAGSVLWLRDHSPVTTRNLVLAAQAHKIDPRRLVFARTVPTMADHLARHRHADLFLDTFVYGAHSTAADAIGCGVPVLTLAGPAMPARVGASLCHAYGCGDLVVDDIDAYVETAVALAGDAERRAQLSETLAAGLAATRDASAFAEKLEAAYARLWQAKCDGTLTPGRVIGTAAE